MKILLCILAVFVATSSGALFLRNSSGRGWHGGGSVHSVKVIHEYSTPSIQQQVETVTFIERQDNTLGSYSQSSNIHRGGGDLVKLISQQPSTKMLKVFHQQPKIQTLKVIRDVPGENAKTVQLIRSDESAANGGYPVFGDAFETLKSLKAFGAFSGNGGLLNSYGEPIAGSWKQL